MNDRSVGFSERCICASDFLNDSSKSGVYFPGRHQFLFDWLTGSLIKQAKGDSAKRPEVFLAGPVWDLMESFLAVVSQPKKRRLDADYTKCFGGTVLTVKVPLLTIFQASLMLVTSEVEDAGRIQSIILGFLKQNNSSIPVNLSQIMEFISTLSAKAEDLSLFGELLQISLSILNQIIASGAANYKKSYPTLLKFALTQPIRADEVDLWTDCWQKCLFPDVDELLALLTGEAMKKLLKSKRGSVNFSDAFPKTVSIQKLLFVELAALKNAVSPHSLASIYQAFLKSAGERVNRESGFNFLAFLIAHCPAVQVECDEASLANLLAILHARGNEIYQQRNDEIYAAQSAIIELVFLQALKARNFRLLLEIAKLNYYLVVERITDIVSFIGTGVFEEEFMIGIFKLAAQANQVPVFIDSLLAVSEWDYSMIDSVNVGDALATLFAKNVPLQTLSLIYSSLSSDPRKLRRSLLKPVSRNIERLIDAHLLDQESYFALQRTALKNKDYDLLTLLVTWTPTHVHLCDELFVEKDAPVELSLALKYKNPQKIAPILEYCKDYSLIVAYLPLIASDLSEKSLKSVAKWLMMPEQRPLLLQLLASPIFFEIEPFRPVFLKLCAGDAEIIAKLPAEYMEYDEALQLAKSLLKSDAFEAMSAVLVDANGTNLRSGVLNNLITDELKSFSKFLQASSGDLISKCVEADKSEELCKYLLKRDDMSLALMARVLKYDKCKNKSVKKRVEKLLSKLQLDDLDALEVILAKVDSGKAAEIISRLQGDAVKLLALKCKFMPQAVNISEAVNLLKNASSSGESLRRNLVAMIKTLPDSEITAALDALLSGDLECWFLAIGQLLTSPSHSVQAFTHFFAHFDKLSLTASCDPRSFLATLKAACQLKRNVTWNEALLARVLGTLRSRLVARNSASGEEICIILRILISQHWRHLKLIAHLLFAILNECIMLPNLDHQLARVINELSSLRLGQIDAYSLLPLMHAFTRAPMANRSRALQMAMNGLLNHINSQPQLLQLLSSALIVEEDQRLILKNFLDEYNKFYKYTGRA